MQAPVWMFSHYLHSQWAHIWDVPGGVPQSIVAHAVFATNAATKQLVLKMNRWWQWDRLSVLPRAQHECANLHASLSCCVLHAEHCDVLMYFAAVRHQSNDLVRRHHAIWHHV